MSSDRLLFWFIVGVGVITTYLMVTSPERKEIEEDWWDQ